MTYINDLTNEELQIVESVLHNCHGYPMSKDSSLLLGFDSNLCSNLFRKILNLGKEDEYIATEEEKKIILKSFEVFISEVGIDIIPTTSHTESEVEALHEKLKKMWAEENDYLQ